MARDPNPGNPPDCPDCGKPIWRQTALVMVESIDDGLAEDVHLTCCRHCKTVWTYRMVDDERVFTRGTEADKARFINVIESTYRTAVGQPKGSA